MQETCKAIDDKPHMENIREKLAFIEGGKQERIKPGLKKKGMDKLVPCDLSLPSVTSAVFQIFPAAFLPEVLSMMLLI